MCKIMMCLAIPSLALQSTKMSQTQSQLELYLAKDESQKEKADAPNCEECAESFFANGGCTALANQEDVTGTSIIPAGCDASCEGAAMAYCARASALADRDSMPQAPAELEATLSGDTSYTCPDGFTNDINLCFDDIDCPPEGGQECNKCKWRDAILGSAEWCNTSAAQGPEDLDWWFQTQYGWTFWGWTGCVAEGSAHYPQTIGGCCNCYKVPPPTAAPTTRSLLAPTPAPPCDSATCEIFEDPHVQVFDGAQISLLTVHTSTKVGSDEVVGDKWLVKSNLVSIQAKYMEDARLPNRNLFVRAIAIGGAFVQNHTIVIGSLEDTVTFDGAEILGHKHSSFAIEEGDFFLRATRSNHSALVQDLSKTNQGIDLELPMRVNLVANRLHHHVNIAIKMPPQEGGQDGLCGNFNGLAADDALELATKRFETNVQPAESLFQGQSFE